MDLKVSGAPVSQEEPAITSDGAGGAIIAWFDGRSGSWEIYAQHVLASGEIDPAWTTVNGDANGTRLRHAVDNDQQYPFVAVVSDGAGGAIVAWTDYRSGSAGDIYAQHVLSSGVVDPAWTAANGNADGTALCRASADQILPRLVADGAGGAIATWTDSRNGNEDIFAQHVLASGVVDPVWIAAAGSANGIAVCHATGDQVAPSMVSDGAGGAIAAWTDGRYQFEYGTDIYAQHVLSSGMVDPVWFAANGNPNGTPLCRVTGDQGFPTITSDGAGGAIIAWADGDIHAQHVLSSGIVDPSWTAANGNANGTPVCSAENDQAYPVLVPDGAGGAIVAWGDGRTSGRGRGIYAQHVLGSGVVDAAWTAANGDGNGTALSQAQSSPKIVSDGAGGAIVTWEDFRGGGYRQDIYAQRVLASGARDPAWIAAAGDSDGLPVCTAPNEQSAPAITSDGAGGAIVTWQDLRDPDPGWDIYAQRVTTPLCAEALPRPAFSATPTSGTSPLEVRFTDQSIAGGSPITSWLWNFGDNEISTSQNPIHTYNPECSSTYTVKLTVAAGACGATASRTSYITVTAMPAPPALVEPATGAIDVPVSTALRWNPVQCATSYRLQVSTDSSFSSTVVDQTVYWTYDWVHLAPGTVHYWRVSATNSTGTGPYSVVWSFTTSTVTGAPAAPTLAAPASGSSGVPVNSTLSWYPVSTATSYRLQVSTSLAFSTTVVNQSGITGTSYPVSLAPGTLYYWRVNASNGVGTGAYSYKWSFTTGCPGPPSAPALVYPGNGASALPIHLALSWNLISCGESYRLQVSTSDSFSTTVVDQPGIVGPGYVVSLDVSTHYCWRVRASDQAGDGPWSSAWSFATIGGVPRAPMLVFPADGATSILTRTTLLWTPDVLATSSRLQVSTGAEFSTTVVDQAGITARSYDVDLSPGTLYYWRVDGSNADGTGPYSAARSFTTCPGVPSAPALVFPPNGARAVPPDTILSWNPVGCAETYRLQVSVIPDFTTLMVDQPGILGTSSQVSLIGDTLFYWRVSASNPTGTGPFSAAWTFRIKVSPPGPPGPPAPPVEHRGPYRIPDDPAWAAVSVSSELSFIRPGAWPNPSSGNIVVSFSLPQASAATLDLVDVAGRRVMTRSIGSLGIGRHVLSLEEGRRLPNGVYTLRLTQQGRAVSTSVVIVH